MNERIRAIWEINDSIPVVWPETGSPVSVSATTLERFAELIVQDCLFIIDDERKSEMVSRIELWKQVKQHFGVDK